VDDACVGGRRVWRKAPKRLNGRLFRWLVLATALACGCAAGMAGAAAGTAPARPAVSSVRSLLDSAARSMIRHHIRGPQTGIGWAWPSAIQAPQVNTDRDVGAASVGMGFIAAYQTTGEPAYLHAAEEAADWLVSIAEPARGGLHWPNSESATAIDHTSYTSFDDGVMGIADFLYRVYALDHHKGYLRAAEAGLRWEEAVAHGADDHSCPAECFWRWDAQAGIYTGMGMGVSGIAYTFDLFAQRTGSAKLERYAIGAARYVESLINRRYDAVPEQPGQPGWDTGYLSGSAGDAFMFLSLYQHTRDKRWLRDAVRLLGFVDRRGHVSGDQEGWPIEFDPSGRQNNNAIALGTEEGNAGIGWAMLNAYEVTHRTTYLTVAERAGNYLVAHLTRMPGGLACVEDIGSGNTTLFHTSLDNGAAGCGFFLHDLSIVTGIERYQQAAESMVGWLRAIARTDQRGIWWYDQFNARSGRWIHPREMSWHWGQAGIIAFLSRLSGWAVSMPVEEQSILPLSPAVPAQHRP
jgi:rhamnogalacturonyl hydrolase YesR